MHRTLYLTLGLLAVGCVPAKTRVAPAPKPSEAATCDRNDPAIIFLIDGRPTTCTSAMGLAPDRIASIEMLKGDAAVTLYGPSARAGVVVIQTKR
jgi:hypothetical protein